MPIEVAKNSIKVFFDKKKFNIIYNKIDKLYIQFISNFCKNPTYP
jgi:hypothetical protein